LNGLNNLYHEKKIFLIEVIYYVEGIILTLLTIWMIIADMHRNTTGKITPFYVFLLILFIFYWSVGFKIVDKKKARYYAEEDEFNLLLDELTKLGFDDLNGEYERISNKLGYPMPFEYEDTLLAYKSGELNQKEAARIIYNNCKRAINKYK
jgi:hypothetical protein